MYTDFSQSNTLGEGLPPPLFWSNMKLVLTGGDEGPFRDSYEYSVWLYYDPARCDSRVYGVEGEVDLRLLFKLRTLIGKVYIQSEQNDDWWSYLEYDNLYKEFVDKKK